MSDKSIIEKCRNETVVNANKIIQEALGIEIDHESKSIGGAILVAVAKIIELESRIKELEAKHADR